MMNFNFVFNRARNIIVSPKTEWTVIQSEAQSKEVIIKTYAIPFMLIMTVCSVIGSIIMVSNMGFAIVRAIGIFGLTYVGLYISALIINELTTSFNSKKDKDATFRLVIYSSTAYFIIMSIVSLLPPLSMLSVFGLFSVYLFWEGTSILLETPEDNKIGFVVVSTLVIAGVFAILYLILGGILSALFAAKLMG
ncbi:MAG TPA: YIP1 family protein [Bacteroidales bacterium]